MTVAQDARGNDSIQIQHATARLGSRELNNTRFSHALTRTPYRFEPDTVWEYSRATELLGALIDRVGGHPFGHAGLFFAGSRPSISTP